MSARLSTVNLDARSKTSNERAMRVGASRRLNGAKNLSFGWIAASTWAAFA